MYTSDTLQNHTYISTWLTLKVWELCSLESRSDNLYK